MKKTLAATGLALATAVVPMVLAAGPAHAADTRSDACGTSVCGSATLAFSGKRSFTVNMSVIDKYCNGYNGYIQLKVWKRDGTVDLTTRRYDTTGGNACDTLYTSYNGLTYSTTTSDIMRVEARVGDDGGYALVGDSVDNNYT